jgi:hypothetical protein
VGQIANLPDLRAPASELPAVGQVDAYRRFLSALPMLVAAAWGVLLAAVLGLPWLLHSTDPGDALIRNTIRLALLYYTIALNIMLWLQPVEWAATGRGRLARLCWTLAWLTYLVHLGMAFHFYHDWSHADAVRHTEEVSGFGAGIYVSHLFTLVWSADVFVWWLLPQRYALRTRWLDGLLHGFMLFVVFNGTVVYETGFIRWAGALVFAELGIMGIYARLGERRT